MKRKQTNKYFANIIVIIITSLIIIIFNFPIISTIMTSFKTNSSINTFPPSFFPKEPTLEHYLKVLYPSTSLSVKFPRYLLNSCLIALGTSFLTIFVCLPASYAFEKIRFGKKIIFPALVNLRAIPLVIFAIPIYIFYQKINLIDTIFGLILLNCVVNIPLAILIFTGFIQDLPEELEDAARIDGASTFSILRYVIFPLMKPAIATVEILVFIMTWNEFLFGMILSVEKSLPITVGITMFAGAWSIDWGAIAAAISIGIIPSIIFILFARKFLIKGLTMGAVKE